MPSRLRAMAHAEATASAAARAYARRCGCEIVLNLTESGDFVGARAGAHAGRRCGSAVVSHHFEIGNVFAAHHRASASASVFHGYFLFATSQRQQVLMPFATGSASGSDCGPIPKASVWLAA